MPLIGNNGVAIPNNERTRCEVWDRVMGYFRPVADWNTGKQQEHRERVRFRMAAYPVGDNPSPTARA